MTKEQKKLMIVGSGVSGIMTAWMAAKEGFEVELFSKSPDPRLALSLGDNHESSTFDSKNDQRYITIFEGHPYMELDGYVNKVYPNIANDFVTQVMDGGVLIKNKEEFSAETQAWLDKRYEINKKLLAKDPEEMARVEKLFLSYTLENRAAMEDWYLLLAEVIHESPEIITDLCLRYEGIVRLYDDEEVFNQSLRSHKHEHLFIKSYTAQEMIEEYPAYTKGVERGFIKGGAIETYGLAFAIGVFCRNILDKMTAMDNVKMNFNVEAHRVLLNDAGEVHGVEFTDGQVRSSTNYSFHTGAFAGPELFENIPQAKHQLAAVEGYWITVENAKDLLLGMGKKPNKVHGKKNLKEVLGMVNQAFVPEYLARFEEMGISQEKLEHISPIVDFNNMTLIKRDSYALGVGSGYVFKGLAVRDEAGQVTFPNHVKSEQFVLTVMELWLEALHGKELLRRGNLVVHPSGCKRNYTIDDGELDVNIPTTNGGFCMIEGGGNTGSTTKSTFISKYIVEKLKKSVDGLVDKNNFAEHFAKLRIDLSKSADDVSYERWQEVTDKLGVEVERAKRMVE